MIRTVARAIYDRTLRPALPRRWTVYNGVAVRQSKLLDGRAERPGYEHALVAAVRRTVSDGDTVAVVGGGLGVSAVHATRQGAEQVYVYEAGREQYRRVCEALAHNDTRSAVTTEWAVVGDDVDVWGEAGPTMAAADLPAVDVLILDCEGAEAAILDALDQRPRAIIVESHGHLGSPTEAVREQLQKMGYEIVDEQPEDAANDVYVLCSAVER